MQDCQIKNNLFNSNGIKSMTVENYPQDISHQKNFMNGLRNARDILNDLEASFKETNKYEEELMHCRSTHAHEHRIDGWLSEDLNDKKCSQPTVSEKQDYGAAVETWSTMSIICLQFQYEELSKRYKALLRECEERSAAANDKDEQLSRLRDVAVSTHAQLIDAHAALLAVGEKYMALRRRKQLQKHAYSRKVHRLKNAVKELVASADLARQELDARLKKVMRTERHGGDALLLAEVPLLRYDTLVLVGRELIASADLARQELNIRKCNHLCLENLRLKAQIQELISRNVAWN